MRHLICSVIGARPQFVKSGSLSREISGCDSLSEFLVHTGQHYDNEMSAVFFSELGIPEPEYNLGAGSTSHGAQTALILERLEKILLERKPELVIVYGDTNSTIGGALAAAKLNIPVAHVEAGLRCGDMAMPEEINRVLTDRISTLLFCPTESSVQSLGKENITSGVHLVGDVMVDAFNMFRMMAKMRTDALASRGLSKNGYALLTVHRAENTMTPENLLEIFKGCESYGKPVFFPAHPRTSRFILENGIAAPPNIILAAPASYLDMLSLQLNASIIITDSGGIQKEAYLAGKPCVTLRNSTEWVETVESGWNILVGANSEKIADALENFSPSTERKEIFGPAGASARIVKIIENFLNLR